MKTHEVKLVLANNHYYVYKGPRRIIATDLETNIKTNFSYLFYDFETYVDNRTGQLKPYAMSYNFVSNDNKESGVILKDNIEDNIEKKIAEFFMRYLDNHVVCLVGFNNSAFDDYILIDILSSHFKKLSKVLLDSRSRILSAVYNNKFFTKDLYRFLMTSLRKAAKNFKCDINKKSLDHRQVQDHVDNGTFTQYVDINKDSIIEYSLYDVLSLTELYFKVSKSFLKINENMSIDSSVTLSHMTMKAYKKYLMSLRDTSKPMSLPIVSTFEYDEIIRKAMIGGRCQIFNLMEEKNYHVQSIDVVSLYPFVMMNKEFPYLPETYVGHKTWKKALDKEWFIATDVFVENKFGIYEAEILSQPFDKVVPKRNDDNTWDWACEQCFKCWVDNITLHCLRRHGGSFKVISGYYFDLPQDKIFSSFLEPMMKEKMCQDEYHAKCSTDFNPALRECIKLLMNSLSGKMGQLPITTDKTICDTQQSCDKFLDKHQKSAEVMSIRNKLWLLKAKIEKPKIKSPTILAVLIYAYAREYMYDNFISKVRYKYGMDTDSLFIRISEIKNLDQNLIGTNFGQVKYDLKYDDCYGIYAGKKMYANYRICDDGMEEIIKYKFKGIGPNDKQIPLDRIDEIKNLIKDDNLLGLRQAWKEFSSINKLQILRDILNQDSVYVLCNHIKRKFIVKDVDNSFTINDTYILKEFGKNKEQNYTLQDYF